MNKPSALIIDDHRFAADSLCQMLSLLGIRGQAAYGARAGMLALNQTTPDIIFMDLNLPGINGFEVMAYVRRLPHLVKTPVVFVTSDDQPETEEKARQNGALCLIVKPPTIEALEAALKEVKLI